jgi:filamentous hemagglutinin
VTSSEYGRLSQLPTAEIARQLGLPAEQAIRGTQLGFEAYSMTPKPGTSATVFTSKIAPVEQGSYTASGGAQQTLAPNRTLWADPTKIGSISGVSP